MVAASGNMRKADLDRYLRSLQKQARGPRGRRPKAAPVNPSQLAAMKIKTERG